MNFVLERYEQDGVEELGEDKLGDLIKLSKFGTIQDAEQAFGGLHQIKQAYNELQANIDRFRDLVEKNYKSKFNS